MPTVADYQILKDSGFNLAINNERSLTFRVPSNIAERGAILNFKFDPSSDAKNLKFEVDLNGQYITSLSNIDSGMRRFESETFPENILDTNGDNTLEFRVQESSRRASGTISFSDIVVWYQIPS